MAKIKIALAAVLFAATSSAAFASYYDPNLANRYPGYAEPNTYGYSASGKLGDAHSAAPGTLQSAPVGLQRHGERSPATARCRVAERCRGFRTTGSRLNAPTAPRRRTQAATNEAV